ncbi:PREDICTED: uncharacterized protein LOC109115147 [Nelumbo nucifera]|uniref:Uncharacterized protein LOC109115147 n=1 Tax=Nelumbo nucifera TaxID=4432 RepID=A0A1U8Q6C4_NELNU|nr:PREDICTED: uncharacterized protein LOC109115147 [Nelumbo nucifera]
MISSFIRHGLITSNNLRSVFSLLHQHQFYAKFSKCSFGHPEIEYFGHFLSTNGVKADPRKIHAMLSWPQPSSVTTLRGFLGLTGYYHKFVHGYASIIAPLTDLLKHNQFHWHPVATEAFLALKTAMAAIPVLALPDFTIPFTVETDTSIVAIGAVLSQAHHPIAFYSERLGPRLQSASTYA